MAGGGQGGLDTTFNFEVVISSKVIQNDSNTLVLIQVGVSIKFVQNDLYALIQDVISIKFTLNDLNTQALIQGRNFN